MLDGHISRCPHEQEGSIGVILPFGHLSRRATPRYPRSRALLLVADQAPNRRTRDLPPCWARGQIGFSGST
jgi:hypothetical protein